MPANLLARASTNVSNSLGGLNIYTATMVNTVVREIAFVHTSSSDNQRPIFITANGYYIYHAAIRSSETMIIRPNLALLEGAAIWVAFGNTSASTGALHIHISGEEYPWP